MSAFSIFMLVLEDAATYVTEMEKRGLVMRNLGMPSADVILAANTYADTQTSPAAPYVAP